MSDWNFILFVNRLTELKSKLARGGFLNINFSIINTRFSADQYSNLKNVSGDIPVYQDSEEDKTWEILGAGKDHMLIVDKYESKVFTF